MCMFIDKILVCAYHIYMQQMWWSLCFFKNIEKPCTSYKTYTLLLFIIAA